MHNTFRRLNIGQFDLQVPGKFQARCGMCRFEVGVLSSIAEAHSHTLSGLLIHVEIPRGI